VVCWRNNSQGTYDPSAGQFRQMTGHARKGVADIIGVLPGGRALFIEVKSKGGRLSSEQSEFIKEVSNTGALAFMADDLKSCLKHFTNIPGLDTNEITRIMELL